MVEPYACSRYSDPSSEIATPRILAFVMSVRYRSPLGASAIPTTSPSWAFSGRTAVARVPPLAGARDGRDDALGVDPPDDEVAQNVASVAGTPPVASAASPDNGRDRRVARVIASKPVVGAARPDHHHAARSQ